jgi:hypothetical protein
MNEELLRERLRQAAETGGGPAVVDATADLERGRRVLRRRRRLALGGSIAATVVVVAAGAGVGQRLGSGDPGSDRGAPVAGQETSVVAPTAAQRPRESDPASQSPTQSSSVDAASSIDRREWRYGLYDLAKEHLDPKHQHLNYDTDNLQGGGGANGATTLGIKLGWSAPGESGEGMVQIAVATPNGRRLLYPCAYFGRCHEVQVPGHGTVVMSGDPESTAGYAVIVEQDDGEYVQVVVDPLFGNNSLTPTQAGLVGLDKVLALAEDPALNLL